MFAKNLLLWERLLQCLEILDEEAVASIIEDTMSAQGFYYEAMKTAGLALFKIGILPVRDVLNDDNSPLWTATTFAEFRQDVEVVRRFITENGQRMQLMRKKDYVEVVESMRRIHEYIRFITPVTWV